ncbi:MAG TPA: hypothetical protein P5040_01800 [Smithella sp.]|nr:hypothetical protein [Smithella sp.]HRS96888.1 hypothetical protein [Smithella sp.]
MLKIRCSRCDKSFFWTDDTAPEGKCPTADCSWCYNVHVAFHENIAQREES